MPRRAHNQTHAPQQTAQLLDYTISDGEHSRRILAGFEINDKFKSCWTFNWQLAGLGTIENKPPQ